MSASKFAAVTFLAVAMLSTPALAEAKPGTNGAVAQYRLAQANKALVTKAYQELFGDHDLTALDRYWAEDYIQHNPTMKDGRDSVKTLLQTMGVANWPKQKVDFKRVVAEGDLVMTQVVQPKMGDMPETVIVDIFRVEKGKIAEHWDVIQPVPANATNPRPMY